MSQAPIALITGASRGIGHAIAIRFAAEGWRVITCARQAVPPECRRVAGITHHVQCDLTLDEDRVRFIEDVQAHLDGQPLQALVNNAGFSPKTPYKERLGSLNGELASWHTVFELNFFAPLILARGFAGALARGRGSIVNITSIAGHSVHPFAGSAYSTSKAALSALTREMAVEFAELGVRVNAVAPGEIETTMLSPETEVLLPRIPLNRLGKPEDVAGLVFHLCGADSQYITGSEIFVTGGQHLL